MATGYAIKNESGFIRLQTVSETEMVARVKFLRQHAGVDVMGGTPDDWIIEKSNSGMMLLGYRLIRVEIKEIV